MATRPDQDLSTNAIIVTKVVKASSAVTLGMPVSLSSGEVLDSTTGQAAYGVALHAAAAGENVQICIFGGPVPVKVGTVGATQGECAVVGTTGAIDQTFGGGTTLAHGLGRFTQAGASGDLVGFLVCPFKSVKA